MEKEKRTSKRTTAIKIEPYLAEYLAKKFKIDEKTGGVKIPYTTDLYFVVWNLMAKPDGAAGGDIIGQSGIADADPLGQEGANLKIHLPARRSFIDGCPGKDPAYFNHLSSAAAKQIEKSIRLMFDFEFHRLMMENEEMGRPKKNLEVVSEFIHRYGLKSITEDALLKNFYRYKQRLFPKKTRKYQKNRGI